jgi:outer membrane protein insertion porin family
MSDWIGNLRVQGGHIVSIASNGRLAAIDQYFKGPELVRGFASNGLGPRDIATISGIKPVPDSIGGTTYWGISGEVTFPLAFLPKDFGMRAALFADAGSVFGYNATRNLNGLNVNVADTADHVIRSAVGVGLIWASPFGPIRFDYAWVLSKGTYDQEQAFRFSGGTRF